MIKELNYTLEKQDYKNFARESIFMPRTVRKNTITFIVLSLIISFYIVMTSNHGYETIYNFLISYIYIFFICFVSCNIIGVLTLFLLPKVIKTTNYDNLNVILQLDSACDFLNITTNTTIQSLSDTKFKWNAIFEIHNKKHNLLLYTSEYAAIIIPKRIFANQQEIDEFWNLVSECYSKAKAN